MAGYFANRYASLIARIVLSLLIACMVNLQAFADKKTEQNPVFKKYYNECMVHLDSPEVLKMADTLYNRACEVNNKYYQVMARFIRLDYYYFKNDKDMFLKLVPEMKQMSREYGQLDDYYFIWGSRLITFYLKNGQPNHALLEAQNMLREAQAENFLPGIVECYKAMANIYQVQSNSEQAAYNLKRLIDVVNEQENKDINMPVYYNSLIDNLIDSKRIKEAEDILQQAQVYLNKVDSVTAYQQFCLAESALKIYAEKNDELRVRKAMAEIEDLFATYPKKLSVFMAYLRSCRLSYYMTIKDYPKALAAMDTIYNHNPSFNVSLSVLKKRAEVYWRMNDRAKAAEYFRDYIVTSDSVRKLTMQRSVDEIAGLFNLRQLEQEKQELKIDIQNRRLASTYWAIGTLALILIIASVVIVYISRLNRKLKASKQIVEKQNEALLQSSEELRKAKESAEAASRMKTDFIQNITHEVRTPLNAIVGFSQVLVDSSREPEMEEFASLITVNTNHLLRLFQDVLELSSADQEDNLPYDEVDDINSSCWVAIREAEPFVKEGVKLIFHPSEEYLHIKTNPIYVKLILRSLLHNATKFTMAGSITLDYAISPLEGIIRYSLTDTGIGIPADQCEAVFERFKKLDYFTQGAGLGLSVARTIATKLGGTLHVDTNYSGGARLVLILPFIPE